jgi:hypothetical protein
VGVTTFLTASAEDRYLVAETPALAVFVIGQLLEGDAVTVVGPADLVAGERATC